MADIPPVDSNNADDLNDRFTEVYDELKRLALMHMAEAAEVMQISLSTANRDWSFARAWLARELVE